MALRNQPYIPLYVQDIMTDEKLNECSAATHGIYIKGIMCLMHKSETYGKILLKQKFKQNSSKEKAFACLLAKHLPYAEIEIEDALTELISEGVCQYEGDYLVQKRMVKDNEISLKRSESGGKGGKKRVENVNNFAQAKTQANTEYESEYVNEDNNTLHNLLHNKVKPINENKNLENGKSNAITEVYQSQKIKDAAERFRSGKSLIK